MEVNIWRNLPEDMLFMILARLPLRNIVGLKPVCKRWNYVLSSFMGNPNPNPLQVMDPNLPLRSDPGFLLHLYWHMGEAEEWERETGRGTWVIEGNGSQIYRIPLEAIVMEVSKSVLCSILAEDTFKSNPDFYLSNPATGTWRRLTLPSREGQRPLYMFFTAMAFDVSTRRCTVIVGGHCDDQSGGIHKIAMEIYDSESDVWTRVYTLVSRYIQPHGSGVHRGGKFYWRHCLGVHDRLAVLTVADMTWKIMQMPQVRRYRWFRFAGFDTDGRLVVAGTTRNADYKIKIWKLNEGEGVGKDGYEWHEWHLDFPPEIVKCKIWVNGSRCVVWDERKLEVHICNDEGRLMRTISIPKPPNCKTRINCSVLQAYEFNNVWWP